MIVACSEAYNNDEEQYACSLGCQNQLPFALQQQEQVIINIFCQSIFQGKFSLFPKHKFLKLKCRTRDSQCT